MNVEFVLELARGWNGSA